MQENLPLDPPFRVETPFHLVDLAWECEGVLGARDVTTYEIVGEGRWHFCLSPPVRLVIDWLHVETDYRGEALGEAMLRHMIRRAQRLRPAIKQAQADEVYSGSFLRAWRHVFGDGEVRNSEGRPRTLKGMERTLRGKGFESDEMGLREPVQGPCQISSPIPKDLVEELANTNLVVEDNSPADVHRNGRHLREFQGKSRP